MNPVTFYWNRWFSKHEKPVACTCERCSNPYIVKGMRNNTGLCFGCALDIIAKKLRASSTDAKPSAGN